MRRTEKKSYDVKTYVDPESEERDEININDLVNDSHPKMVCEAGTLEKQKKGRLSGRVVDCKIIGKGDRKASVRAEYFYIEPPERGNEVRIVPEEEMKEIP